MNKDTHKTRVQFLYHDANDDLFAFFPDESEGNGMALSYSYIGQHSLCNLNYASEARPAEPEEYKDLKQELESLGYNLEII